WAYAQKQRAARQGKFRCAGFFRRAPSGPGTLPCMIFGFRRGEKSILKRFSVEDLWKLKRPAGVSLSADGSRAVVSVTSYSMKENRANASLWLASASGGA